MEKSLILRKANIPSIGSSIPIMPSITLSTEGIEALLSKLDTNKTAGPDQIPSYISNIVLTKLHQFFKLFIINLFTQGN